jgi:multidrug efflux pump subunit AcrB
MMNLLEGIIFVVIVVFIGMGLRNAFVVSTAIPISILMTFGVMFLSGIKIHQMSLTALIIALGVLVDNAIVIADSIQVKLDNGIDVKTAAIKSTSESSIPIFTATLTTVAAFSPLLGLPGAAGEFMKAIPLVLIISIVAAYIVSMTITPALGVFVLKKNENKVIKESKIRKSFERMLNRGLNHRKGTAFGMLVVFVLVMKFVLPSLETEFFPFVDKNVVYIDVDNEISGNIKSTEKLADEIEKRIKDMPEINSISTAIGNGMPKFYITMKPAIPSSDYAQIVVKFDVKNEEHRFKNNEEFVAFLQDKLDNEVPNGTCIVNLLQNAEPLDARVLLRVSGENSEDINSVAKAMGEEMKNIDGATNIRDDIKDDIFKYNIDVDVDKASSMGISKYDIQRQINIALYGANASVYRKDGNEYNIKVDSDVNSTSDINNMMIKSSLTEYKIPVRQFASIDLGTQTDTITKYQREKSVKILADVLPYYDSSSIESQIENEILKKLDLEGIDVDFDGEREQIKKYFSAVGVLAAFAVFLIYVILVVQFNSFLEPMVILLTIPLSLIGSVLGLKLLNQPLSLTAFLGIIALIGLVVKNGILLIEFINDAKDQGHSVDESCKDAVDKRFNAIILSAATTVMGLLPLALSNSSLFAPMAVSLMSGLIVSTFLTMVIIPVIYSMIFNRVSK